MLGESQGQIRVYEEKTEMQQSMGLEIYLFAAFTVLLTI